MLRNKKTRIVAVFIFLLYLHGCGKIKSIPEELLGVWETSDPRYAETYFEFGLNMLSFKDKEGNITDHMITSIKRKKTEGNNWLEYKIKYKNKETKEIEFSFYYDPTDKGSLRLKNQELIVWQRKERD